MKTSPHFRATCLLSLAAGGLSWGQNLEPPQSQSAAQGAQIGWASNAFATNLMADGVTTFEEAAQAIYFELGTFKSGFDPVTATQAQWAENWIVLQSTAYDKDDQQFIQTATLTSNAGPFFENSQAYIWGYTSKDTDPASQWILMSASTWKWPNSAGQPVTYSVGDPTVIAITGLVNPNPGAGDYHMQFDYVVVPEPSSSLLAGAAALGFVWRRRR